MSDVTTQPDPPTPPAAQTSKFYSRVDAMVFRQVQDYIRTGWWNVVISAVFLIASFVMLILLAKLSLYAPEAVLPFRVALGLVPMVLYGNMLILLLGIICTGSWPSKLCAVPLLTFLVFSFQRFFIFLIVICLVPADWQIP